MYVCSNKRLTQVHKTRWKKKIGPTGSDSQVAFNSTFCLDFQFSLLFKQLHEVCYLWPLKAEFWRLRRPIGKKFILVFKSINSSPVRALRFLFVTFRSHKIKKEKLGGTFIRIRPVRVVKNPSSRTAQFLSSSYLMRLFKQLHELFASFFITDTKG